MESQTESINNRKYLKSLIKRIYRWSRISSYQSKSFDANLFRITKINKIITEIDKDFKDGHMPKSDDIIFHKTYSKLFSKFVKNNDDKEFYNKHFNINMNTDTNQAIDSKHKNNINRTQNVLVMLDYDDTLIPSTVIKQKKFRVTEMNTTDQERDELNQYVESLNKFMDKLLLILNANRDNNIKIVTNASSSWVTQGSFCRTGSLFAMKMREFNEKMAEAKISIISALDHSKRNKAIFGDLKLRQYKKYLMKWLYSEYFGTKLMNLNQDIKIISIGDSSMEFKASDIALKYYLNEQNKDVLSKINVTLHRIKFMKKPESFSNLSNELKWCYQNMESMVYENHKSTDYDLEFLR